MGCGESRAARHDVGSQAFKIITLGAGESGKTTIWKQLRIANGKGFTKEERTIAGLAIRENVIQDMIALLREFQDAGHSVARIRRESAEAIMGLNGRAEELVPEVAVQIADVWNDAGLRDALDHTRAPGISDSAGYFFNKVTVISRDDWLPSEEDLVAARVRTIGANNVCLKVGDRSVLVVDAGGQLTERGRWTEFFQGVGMVLFVVSLSDFDQEMFETCGELRTADSLRLISEMAASPAFVSTPFFVVFNKMDLFEIKLRKRPEKFREAYPDFQGEVTCAAALEHVKRTFLSRVGQRSAWVDSAEITAVEKASVAAMWERVTERIK